MAKTRECCSASTKASKFGLQVSFQSLWSSLIGRHPWHSPLFRRHIVITNGFGKYYQHDFSSMNFSQLASVTYHGLGTLTRCAGGFLMIITIIIILIIKCESDAILVWLCLSFKQLGFILMSPEIKFFFQGHKITYLIQRLRLAAVVDSKRWTTTPRHNLWKIKMSKIADWLGN